MTLPLRTRKPSTHHIHHVYHSADPIAMGICNGILSSCALAGYAMETRSIPTCNATGASRILTASFHRCHLGKSIFYDTVSNLSWSVDIRTHAIVPVIDKILSKPWAPSVEVGREVPESKFDDDCVVSEISMHSVVGYSNLVQECYSWEFGDYPPS